MKGRMRVEEAEVVCIRHGQCAAGTFALYTLLGRY